MQEKQKLADLLQDLQVEIDRCIYRPAYVPSLAHGDTEEQRLFSYQLRCKQAADAYQQAWDKALDYLNNQSLHDQIEQWHNIQNDADEQEQLATVQWVDEASDFLDRDRSALRYTESIPQCTWQPPKDLIENLCEPYTALIYEAFSGLLTQMSVCYRSPELNADGEKMNPEETDLLDDVLMPALSFAVNQEWLNTLMEEIEKCGHQDQSEFLVAAVDEITRDNFKPSPPPSILGAVAGQSYNTVKSTFLRGPGAPALAEAIIDLAGQLVKVRYSLNVKVQTQLSIRLYSLHMVTMLRISRQTLVQTSRSAELNRMGRFIYRTLAGKNPVQFRRLMSAEQLSERVYGGSTWGDPSSRLVRFEGYLKTAAFFIDSVIGIVAFMQEMNEKDWDDPSPEAFRSAAYKLATSAETQLTRASGLLTVPSMLRFWTQKLGATEGAMARFLGREIGVGVQMASGIAFGRQGYRLGRWLTGATAGKLATTAGLAAVWANRLCVASSCIALIKNIADVNHSAGLGDEGEIMLNVAKMVANGATVLGFAAPLIGLNAIPGLGNALFIGGVVLSLAIEAWQIYWRNWGRAQWYSNTYVVFDDQWEGFTDSTHAQEYRKQSLGASPKLAGLIKQIEDQRSNTAVDVFRYVSIAYVNSQTAGARAAASILNLPHPKKIEQDSGDVAWNELSWCGLPALMMHQLPVTPEQMDKKLIYIDLNKEECLWLYCFDRDIPQVDWNDYKNNRTTLPADLDRDDFKDNTLKPALKRLLLACYNRASAAPDSPFARLIWQPLVNGGKFPRPYMRLQLAEATENAPFELLEIQMDAGKETGRYVANSHFHKMLKLWESRSALIPKTSSRYPQPPSPDADELQQEDKP
ncbi:hypothetical protein [Gynuella sunshinyii]|uniref:Uncharacterized protein n=1 Tax=Gynuella sunshinyii YC6258 TaxID=1445510 RepID=A0A0C5VTC8_9GAMM|nr:hypothetical protein [Gynuella sunshinyii]AJQ97937.1 hypothetical Protein YC6258_05913 [Gynuella sunshinyii YC6258]